MSDRLTIEQRHNNMADCADTQGGDAEGVLQFFGMRCDEGYVFFSCFHS